MQTTHNQSRQPNDQKLEVISGMVPPHSQEAEQTLLAAVLFAPSFFSRITSILTADDFYNSSHQNLFTAMHALFIEGEPIDILTVSEWLNDNGLLDKSGGRTYVMELAMYVSTAENIVYYAEIIKEKSVLRQLQKLGHEISASVFDMGGKESLDLAQKMMLDISMKAHGHKREKQEDIWAAAFDRLENPQTTYGIPTGFDSLDALTKGFQPGVFILAARPSMGKSALALNLATNVALQGENVLFFSLEVTNVSAASRVLLSMAESKDPKVIAKFKGHEPKSLCFLKEPGLKIADLRAILTQEIMQRGKPGLVVIDFLQLMDQTGKSEYDAVSYNSKMLKQMSLEFELCFLVLSQLSRSVEQRQDKRPMMSDLRSSGSIEQDADIVAFIYRDEYYNKESDRPGVADIIIAKQKEGATGSFELLFRNDIVKFKNPTFGSTRVF